MKYEVLFPLQRKNIQDLSTADVMDDLRFYVLFNSVSVISGRWEVDNERLCAMERRLRLRRFCLERGSNSVP